MYGSPPPPTPLLRKVSMQGEERREEMLERSLFIPWAVSLTLDLADEYTLRNLN